MVFAEGDIADVVAAVFDAPMLADGSADGGGGQGDLRRIEGCLAGFAPQAGPGILVPGEPGDTGGGVDQAIPMGSETPGNVERLNATMLLPAVTVTVDGVGAVDGRLGRTDLFDRLGKGLLVGFDLNDEKVSNFF